MIEENEIRSGLSQYERGRAAASAVHDGVFQTVDEAVAVLFQNASKAKRSKVRSFALIFEELGDMLEFPDALSEKRGLKLAQTLRQGGETRIRDGLAAATSATSDEEWAVIERVIESLEVPERDPKRGGRPRSAAPVPSWHEAKSFITTSGIGIRRQDDEKGTTLRLEGAALESEVVDSLVEVIREFLENH
jgi:ParB family chromosome partitioning protein